VRFLSAVPHQAGLKIYQKICFENEFSNNIMWYSIAKNHCVLLIHFS
jgi:hypothetical protein